MEVTLPNSFFDEKQTAPSKSEPGYFQRCYHAPTAYCRTENWYPDVKEFSFPTVFVPLSEDQARAILRYREETKLRAAMRDQENREKLELNKNLGLGRTLPSDSADVTPTLEDPKFLDNIFAFIWEDWNLDPETVGWRQSLEKLRNDLEQAITSTGTGGAFVKLSNRSPKDSALHMTTTYNHLDDLMAKNSLLSDVELINLACTDSLRCRSGQHALRLLLESDRIYTDITTYRLYIEQDEPFSLQLAVREWCSSVDPGWEFRLFVRNCVPTALTIYNDFYFSPFMNSNKQALQDMIMDCWSKVKPKIHTRCGDYCIDFAITPDLAHIFIIEVNPFVPPIAGSGLFNFHDSVDRALLEKGPFEFRLRKAPNNTGSTLVTYKDQKGDDAQYVRSLSPGLLRFIQSRRREQSTPGGSSSFCSIS